MSKTFGAESTTDEVLEGIDLTGKRILVTGVSAGLGVETARALVAHGAHVVGAARDLDKARRATEAVREPAKNGGGLELIALDLASLASVRAAADALNAAGKPFDVVIANAGVMMPPKGETADGFETQFGTNHLGHFVFVNRIAGLMKPGSRLVNLSSAGHRFADVDLDDPNFERTPYDPMVAYGRSKTANILFAVEFDRRHKADGIRATAVHPGAIQTELGRHMTPELVQAMTASIKPTCPAQPLFTYKTIPQGAATSVWAGVVAPADLVGGKYCEDCHVAECHGGSRRAHRRPPLCARSRARQGAVGEERGDGRRAFRLIAGRRPLGILVIAATTACRSNRRFREAERGVRTGDIDRSSPERRRPVDCMQSMYDDAQAAIFGRRRHHGRKQCQQLLPITPSPKARSTGSSRRGARNSLARIGVTNIRTFVDPKNPTHVAVMMDVPDMEAMAAAMQSEAAADAMANDGVVPESVVILVES